jgi:arsenical pump membrane protein
MTDWPAPSAPNVAIWAIAAIATAGVILRPGRLPQAAWALGGALALLVCGLLPLASLARGLVESVDVCLFLTGMMLVSELARREGLFDVLAAWAVRQADGSGPRLFALVYGVGVVVTVFLSNDATAVVLTPAVHAAARRAGARPLPYLYACAFVANAASFVLPIANPANLVVFGSHLPPLDAWCRRFALPSALAIVATWAMLRWTMRDALAAPIGRTRDVPPLNFTGLLAALGVAGVVLAMLLASALGAALGLPTLLAAVAAVGAVQWIKRESPAPLLEHVAWGVLAMVAGLFVIVEALARTGLVGALSQTLRAAADRAPHETAWLAGAATALGGNLLNNLPAGLLSGLAVNAGPVVDRVRSAIAIGIDLGPNLSITGSLATILWLAALQREGERVTALEFLRVGAIVMPPALALALAVV